MENTIFRKKSLDRISSPEQLNDYIRVTNPSVWMVLGAVIVLLIGIFVWGIFGQMDTTISVAAMTEDGETTCYVKDADISTIKYGMHVRIGESVYRIRRISLQPKQVDDTFPEYLTFLGDMATGEWVYTVTLDQIHGEDGNIFAADIVIESIAPIKFIVN